MTSAFSISFGLVDGTPVFMDVAGDSYFGLEHDEECAFLASLNKEVGRREPIVHGLVRGFKTEEWEIEPCPLPPPPRRALPGGRGLGKPNVFQMLAVAGLLLAVDRALRCRPIGEILEILERRKSNRSSAALDPITRAIAFRNA